MIESTRHPRTFTAVAALVAITAIWGATFVTVKRAVETVPPFEFLAVRFGVAALVLAVVFPRTAARIGRRDIRAGAAAGLALAAGYAFQTVGLQYTTATNAGFITGLYVVFTPVISAMVLKRPPSATAIAAVVISATGLALLTLQRGFDPADGDVIMVGTGLAFAVHIVLLGKYAPGHDPRALTLVQLAVAGTAFALVTLISEEIAPMDTTFVWFAILLTAVGASALGFLVQTWAQTHLSPTRTAVTLTMEPVFAGAFGYLLAAESISLKGWVGAVLILAAMLIAEIRPERPGEG